MLLVGGTPGDPTTGGGVPYKGEHYYARKGTPPAANWGEGLRGQPWSRASGNPLVRTSGYGLPDCGYPTPITVSYTHLDVYKRQAMVRSPDCTRLAPYQITPTIPPKSAKMINDTNPPRKVAALRALATTRSSAERYRSTSSRSLVKAFTTCTDCRVSSAMTLAAASSSWAFLERRRM